MDSVPLPFHRGLNMLAVLLKVASTARENTSLQMVLSILETSRTRRELVKVFMNMRRVEYMMDFSKTVNVMEKGSIYVTLD